MKEGRPGGAEVAEKKGVRLHSFPFCASKLEDLEFYNLEVFKIESNFIVLRFSKNFFFNFNYFIGAPAEF
jgi:hypothetical protein